MKRLQNFWYNLPVRKKLFFYFVILVFIMFTAILLSFGITYHYTKRFQTILEEHFALNGFLTELQAYGSTLDEALRYKTEKSRTEAILRMQLNRDKMHYFLSRIRKRTQLPVEAFFEIRALGNSLFVYIDLSSRLFFDLNKHSPDFFEKLYTVSRIQYYMERYIANLQRILLTEDSAYCSRIEKDISFFRFIFLTFTICIFFVLFLFALIFSYRFSEPIANLAKVALRMAAGDLAVAPVESTFKIGKEMEAVISAFNSMHHNIKDMIDDLKMKSQLEKMLHAEEIEKESALTALREAQLVSLQNQIKPHFLFNTLNTISRQAQEEQAFQTVNLILFLSHLMRYNLLTHRQSVALKDELNALKDYMCLQQKRFGERIRFNIDCPENLLKVQIPPFTVLTFAENSIRHGLEPCIEGGTLYVQIRKRNRHCRIRIFDNGIGMNKENLYALINIRNTAPKVNSDGTETGIGIRNIMTRLDLFYGGAYSFNCYSKPNYGTLTVISVPLSWPIPNKEVTHV
jgi:Putative regulator of cell autolysis